MLQIVTGILLALVYTPSAGEAWTSLEFLNHQITLGWFLRAIHGWGSDFMVAIVLIHMAQVFLFGAYKYPRELTWIIGVFLLLFTLGMAFTGQVLRFDQDAYWGLGIGASIMSRVPWIGGQLVHFMLGGPIIGGQTLSRFFALHVFVIPGILLACVAVHVWMVLHLGVNEWPMPGRIVSKATYDREYHELTSTDRRPLRSRRRMERRRLRRGDSSCGDGLRALLRPLRPQRRSPIPPSFRPRPSPTLFFLWIYAVLAYLPPELETPFLFIAPVVVIVRHAAASAGCRRRREALVAPSRRRAHGLGHRRRTRHLHAPRHLHAVESDHGMPGPAIRRPLTISRAARRWNDRARSFCRISSAATATRSADAAACAAPHSTPSPRA